MIAEVDGVSVGHWTDPVGRTGCTVILFPEGTVASGEVRGGAPGTREWALLEPGRLVSRLDAVVLSGGSAFGLAACDGVMRWCEEHGRGFRTSGGVVPIVVGAVVFDLGVGDPRARPGPDEGYAAAEAASAGAEPERLSERGSEGGSVGAGTGATYGKWRGREHARPGGVGMASVREGDLAVAALAVVNAVGDVLPPGASTIERGQATAMQPRPFENTTVGVVVTNARLDKTACHLVAQAAHDGLARAVEPAHTRFDGDAIVAAATSTVDASVDVVRVLAARVFEDAVRSVAGTLGP